AFEVVALRMRLRDLPGEDLQFSLSLADGDGGFEPADDGQRVSPAVSFVAEREREIEINVAAGSEHRSEIEGSREHTDDGNRLVVDGECPADNSRVAAETPVPQSMAQQHGF